MIPTAEQAIRIAAIGIGATAVMDLWLLALRRLGVPTGSFALIGRWVGHLAGGRFAHVAIGRASPIRGEMTLGWITHYAVGIGFAALLLGWQGMARAQHPTLGPALLVGALTAVFPLFVMQPAMGAGIASSRTATPGRNLLRSVANHVVFGVDLYLTSLIVAQILR